MGKSDRLYPIEILNSLHEKNANKPLKVFFQKSDYILNTWLHSNYKENHSKGKWAKEF